MTKIEIVVSDNLEEKLDAFKKIVDTVLDEETEQNDYLIIVLSEGLKALLKTVIPQDNEVLWKTIENMANKNPRFVSNFVADTIKQGEDIKKEELKEEIQSYIQ